MLTKNRSITLPMRQSSDVQGVKIDFGGAPDHGRWRAMAMTITVRSDGGPDRKIKWLRISRKGFDGGGYFTKERRSCERVVKIRLDAWELEEE